MSTREGRGRHWLAALGLMTGGTLLLCPIASAEETAKGTWHTLVCTCSDVTSIQPVQVKACLDPSATHIEVGAGLICTGSVAGSIEVLTRLRTLCVYTRISNTGQGPCQPGNFSIVKVGR